MFGGVPKGGGGFFGNMVSVFSLLFRLKGVLSITLILVLVTSIGALKASIE